MAVNASGQIVGIVYGGAGSPTHAFLYSNGAMSDLGTLPGFDCSYAESINSRGQVVGTSQDSSGNLHAFLWSNGVMSDLGMPLGFTWSDALSINTAGQVVGCGGPPDSYSRSFFCSGGCMYDLTGLLDASGAGWTIETAACINDSGQIAGTATIDGWDAHAVLLTPDAGVTGSVKLQDFSGDVTQVPVTVQVRLPGTTDAMQTRTVNLDSSGTFSIPSALTGVFDVSVKASHWLRRTIHGVTFAGDGYVSGLTFTLVDGDVNGDNTVNLPDLIEIAAAWRSTPGSPNWNPNADLNGDGTVDLADWLIVARNWRASGDP
jgi:probable HAF family extracellular repeat protein